MYRPRFGLAIQERDNRIAERETEPGRLALFVATSVLSKQSV